MTAPPTTDHPYVYVLVRDDLSIPQIAVQAVHAAIESAQRFDSSLPEHPSVILCTLPGGPLGVAKASNELQEKGIRVYPFYEADLNHELTAICSEPVFGDRRKLFKKYKLFKGAK